MENLNIKTKIQSFIWSNNILERVGAVAGVLGALIMSMNIEMQFLAFSCYSISNICWLIVGHKKKMNEIFYMSIGYSAISILGFARLS